MSVLIASSYSTRARRLDNGEFQIDCFDTLPIKHYPTTMRCTHKGVDGLSGINLEIIEMYLFIYFYFLKPCFHCNPIGAQSREGVRRRTSLEIHLKGTERVYLPANMIDSSPDPLHSLLRPVCVGVLAWLRRLRGGAMLRDAAGATILYTNTVSPHFHYLPSPP